ncbi:hypothetical protein F5Y19DRAFT_79700 [Xylariaceae sp. FL1651]|nr:hypothetical protein F5Y19DRAFT_79700 [Xylariaceae sp. FL1651]
MASQYSGAATLPKGFQCYDESGPKTPEPFAPSAEEQSPPPPRPRLRLKRRHVSQLNAPTQQFLASIAAADVPIPSVEDAHTGYADQEMMDILPELHVEDFDSIDVCRHLTPRMFSPPKTPAIEFAASLTPTKYPDWYNDSPWSDSDLESSPEYESSRPSTAFSTQTSSSLFSVYSHVTGDGSCISPDLETSEFPKIELEVVPGNLEEDKPRKAPWTRAMSSHLWATYMLYLSDPRVTPIRHGKSCIPPRGVCSRVARQAQRSWKGSKTPPSMESKSQSGTPTAESIKTYIRWPHTRAATRAHLRELCKLKGTNRPGRYLSRSPTPFNRAAHRRWNRRSTSARSPSVFSAQDMAMSLTLSTSDTMQPHGPLALLTSSQPAPELTHMRRPEPTSPHEPRQPEPVVKTPEEAWTFVESSVETSSEAYQNSIARLGSPFLARSYGPSSSSSIATKISLPMQPNTVGPRKLLRSPVRLARSRSGTQKRRSTKGHEEKPWRRPSLAAAFFREGSRNTEVSVAIPNEGADQSLANCGTLCDRHAHQIPFEESPTILPNLRGAMGKETVVSTVLSQSSPTRPPRLGSPFSMTSSSYSFPNRLSSAGNFSLAALRRPFATVQQSPQITSENPAPARSSLTSRLAYLDQRLKELRNRGTDRRRSQSPL